MRRNSKTKVHNGKRLLHRKLLFGYKRHQVNSREICDEPDDKKHKQATDQLDIRSQGAVITGS